MVMRGIAGSAAVVTGAGRGIGRAIALRLAREGADVLVAELDPRTGAAVVEEVLALGRRGLALAVDVTRAADRVRMVEMALSELGRIDILVNNAGIIRIQDPQAITEEDWDQVQAVNCKATFFACQAVLPHMLERGRGRIVNVASIAAKGGATGCIHYNVSKSGVVTLTRNLAVAYGRRGISVNCVCPGIVETEMWAQIDRETVSVLGMPEGEFRRTREAMISLGRNETPEDVANVVSFLCSDDASYISGQAINVEGGLIFH
jgi:meso-butanediol dehydrogenase/(S,S)-butanediol dehydrogenase/diacetyl reductase